MANCGKYAYIENPTIDTISYFNCNTYKGRTNFKKQTSIEGELTQPTADDLSESSNFIPADQLPDIYSTNSDSSQWPNVYSNKIEKIKTLKFYPPKNDGKENATVWRSTAKSVAIYIQEGNCKVYRNAGIDQDGKKFITTVKAKTPIALFNKMQELYDSIKKELAMQDKRIDIEVVDRQKSTKMLAELNTVNPETGVPIMPPCNHNTSGEYTYDKTKINQKYNNKMLIRNDIFYRLNDILKEYSSKVTDIRIRMKVANADDSINKLMINYQSAILNDCICYSDCQGYSVCFCYGNCNHY